MKLEKAKLFDLKLHPENLRVHHKEQKEALYKSYKMFGQIRPVVVDEGNVILAGNGFVESLMDSGEVKEVSVYRVENLSEKDKKKLMLADNQTYEIGYQNHENVMKFLEEIASEDDFEIPGFDVDVVRSMFEITDEEINKYGLVDSKDETAMEEKRARIEVSTEREKEQFFDSKKPEVVELNNEKIMIGKDDDEKESPYVICQHCGEKVWL